ncbi:MAG TPA: amidohydrolase family protein [Blastocatellia bacterium]|nr:amidohydrolase family protein [Blastocatellia bacterium]
MKYSIYSVALLVLLHSLVPGQARGLTVIKGATLIDGTGRAPLKDAVIVINGSRFGSIGVRESIEIPKGARIIDANGKFVMPGLIDCHCHLEMIGLGDLAELPPRWETPEKQRQLALINAKLDLLSGVTTIRDLGSTRLAFKIRDEINAGKQFGPRIFTTGQQLVKKAPGAYMSGIFIEYDGPQDAREKVQQQVRAGADFIKIRLTRQRPLPSLEEVRAIVEEADRLGRRVAVHTDVPDDEAVALAIEAGVDSIEHNAPLRVKNEKLLFEMARRGISVMAGAGGFYVQRMGEQDLNSVLDSAPKALLPKEIIPMLHRVSDSLLEQTGDMKKGGWDPKQVQARFISETQRARKAGVVLLFGTDCGAELMVHGQQYKALYGETQMGSSAMEAILMATRDAAKALGRGHELGTIEAGKLADLIILEADPLADLHNIRKIHAVMKEGKLYRPADLLREHK